MSGEAEEREPVWAYVEGLALSDLVEPLPQMSGGWHPGEVVEVEQEGLFVDLYAGGEEDGQWGWAARVRVSPEDLQRATAPRREGEGPPAGAPLDSRQESEAEERAYVGLVEMLDKEGVGLGGVMDGEAGRRWVKEECGGDIEVALGALRKRHPGARLVVAEEDA